MEEERLVRYVAKFSILAVLTIAALGLIAHIPGLRLLGSLNPGYVQMSICTAVSFIFLGVIYLSDVSKTQKRHNYICVAVAAIISTFGFIKVAEYFMGAGKSFEMAIMTATSMPGWTPLKIMSVPAGAIFFLAGLATVFYILKYSAGRHKAFLGNLTGISGCAVFIGGYIFVLGYLYNAPLLYTSGNVVPMAVTSAVVFMLLGTGLIFTNGNVYFPLKLFSGASATATLLRYLIPFTIMAVTFIDVIHRFLPQYFTQAYYPLVSAVLLVIIVIGAMLVNVGMGRIIGGSLDRSEEERKKTDAALKISELEKRMILESIKDLVVYQDMNNRIIWANESTAQSFGKTVEELKGNFCYKAFHNKDKPCGGCPVVKAVKTGRLEEAEMLIPDGRQWIIKGSPIKNDDGNVVGVVEVAVDITERKRAEREIFAGIESLNKVIESVGDGITVSGQDGYFEVFNAKMEEITGYTADEANASGDFSLLIYKDSEQRSKALEGVRMVVSSKGFHECESEISTKAGYKKDLSILTSLIHYKGRDMFLSVYRDITKQKQVERNLRNSRQLLEGIVMAKSAELAETQKELTDARRLSDIGTLAATIAHELRNPLGVIKTAAFNIGRKTNDPSLNSHLANIDKKIAESDQIIRNLLSYSKLKMPQYEKMACKGVMRECLENLSHKYTGWGVDVNLSCNCKEGDFVMADRFQIVELYSNIIDNAYQSYPDKRGVIEITGAFDRENNAFSMTFKDTGVGMDEEVLSKMGTPFFTTKSKGIGLGFAVCKQIIMLHNGTIDVKSTKGEGTTVCVTLPVNQGQ